MGRITQEINLNETINFSKGYQRTPLKRFRQRSSGPVQLSNKKNFSIEINIFILKISFRELFCFRFLKYHLERLSVDNWTITG